MAKLIPILILLSSCTCNYHLNRAKLKCGYSFKSDTVLKKDTVLINSVQTHTVFYYNQKDTVIVKEGRLTMKYFYSDSTVYLAGKCDTVFVVKDVPIVVNKTEVKESHPWWVHVFLILLAITGIVFVVLTFRIAWKKA